MSTDTSERERLQNELKKKGICRFCLLQTKLTNIFARDSTASLAPLPVQIMACASIEVFTNDGLPVWICCECRELFEHSYRFKQMCKRADTLLRQFPLTGQWPRPLEKPKLLKSFNEPKQSLPIVSMKQIIVSPQSKKILNSSPAAVPEPPVPKRNALKRELLNDGELDNIFNKDDYETLSIEDVQRIFVNVKDNDNDGSYQKPITIKRLPKILNKASVRILNKEANVVVEPKLSVPQVKVDQDGNVTAITSVIGQIYTNADNNSSEPVEPIATDVYPCPHCDRSFPLLQLRDIHMVNHNRERRFQCMNCDKSFFSKYDLQKHEVRHTGERRFKCVACEKGFSRASLLHRHEKIHTEIPKYLCVYCEKAFLSKEEMEQHTARHEKNRPFKCRDCPKTFAFKQGLERHEIVHSSVQPYPCQYCEQSFPTPSKLARHLTAHAGKRPYPCKYCPKSYVLSHHLTRHMRSHKQVKGSHVCSECNKVFKARDELIYHTAVHSTVSLVCTLCLTKLDSAEAVTGHLKEHIDGDAYACEFCDLIFLGPNALAEHSEEKHATELEAYNTDIGLNQKTSITPETETTFEISAIDETQVEYLNEEDDDEDDEEGEEQHAETAVLDKPQILEQIVLSSEKDIKYIVVSGDKKDDSSKKHKDVVEKKEQQIPAVKKRKIISIDGKFKEIEYTPSDATSDLKRKVVVLAEKKVEIKREKDDKNSSSKNVSLPKKTTTPPKESSAASIRRSNEAKAENTIKTEQVSKKIVKKAVDNDASATTSTITVKSPTNAKKDNQPKVKHIRMTKSQAQALSKQGRIQIKDGNMVLTKEPVLATRSSKRTK